MGVVSSEIQDLHAQENAQCPFWEKELWRLYWRSKKPGTKCKCYSFWTAKWETEIIKKHNLYGVELEQENGYYAAFYYRMRPTWWWIRYVYNTILDIGGLYTLIAYYDVIWWKAFLIWWAVLFVGYCIFRGFVQFVFNKLIEKWR